MPYDFEVLEKDGYLLFTVSGEVASADEAGIFSRVVIARALEGGYNRILLDERATSKLVDQHDCAVHADRMTSENPRSGIKIAAVYSSDDARRFYWIETIFQNRSIIYKIFETMDEAEQWLIG